MNFYEINDWLYRLDDISSLSPVEVNNTSVQFTIGMQCGMQHVITYPLDSDPTKRASMEALARKIRQRVADLLEAE